MNNLSQRLSRQKKQPNSSRFWKCQYIISNNSRQSLGKAVKKVTRSLLKSPRKAKKVIQSLSNQYSASSLVCEPEKSNGPSELSILVERFYCEDNISWMTPGIKDSGLVRTPTGKVRIQKRYLLMTLKEAHLLFKESHKDVKCGISVFCSLCPIYVKCLTAISHNTYIHDENVRKLLKSLSKAVDSSNSVPT